MTPSQVARMAARGVSVAQANLPEIYDDANVHHSWCISPENDRGADLNTLWELEKISQDKVLKARRKDKAIYGVREDVS